MAMTPFRFSSRSRGFALLIAIIFMSVLLMFGVLLSALAYKQQLISSSAIESQYAFYAADAALECALYEDQQRGTFAYGTSGDPVPPFECDGAPAVVQPVARSFTTIGGKAYQILQYYRFELDGVDGAKRCADISVYKPNGIGATYVFAEGYDVACSLVGVSGNHYVARGLDVTY